MQAKKEDSGKYICYGGQEQNLLKPITEIELVVRVSKYKELIIKKGDTVILPCEHKIKNLTRAKWSYKILSNVATFVIFNMPGKETLNKNYEALCEPHELSCNLKILEANKESAGRYICMIGESLEFEEKYGLESMTHFIEIEVVVGVELLCNENMDKDLTLIGENDCYGIEADVLNLQCSFNYFGGINYNLLHLRWIEKYKFNSLKKKLNSSLISYEVKDETRKISIQINMPIAYDQQNSTFQCAFENSLFEPCQLQEVRTQYVKNASKISHVSSKDLQNIKCLANKSENVHCSYQWVHEASGAMFDSQQAILRVENMHLPGIYTCLATCHLGHDKECIIKAMEMEVIQGSNVSMFGLIIGLIVVVFFNVVVIVAVLVRKKAKRRNNRISSIKRTSEDNYDVIEDVSKSYLKLQRANNEELTTPYQHSTNSGQGMNRMLKISRRLWEQLLAEIMSGQSPAEDEYKEDEFDTNTELQSLQCKAESSGDQMNIAEEVLESKKQLIEVINLLKISQESKNGFIAELISDKITKTCEVKSVNKSDKEDSLSCGTVPLELLRVFEIICMLDISERLKRKLHAEMNICQQGMDDEQVLLYIDTLHKKISRCKTGKEVNQRNISEELFDAINVLDISEQLKKSLFIEMFGGANAVKGCNVDERNEATKNDDVINANLLRLICMLREIQNFIRTCFVKEFK